MSLVDTWLEDGVACENCGLVTIKLVRKQKVVNGVEKRACICTICSYAWGQKFENGEWVKMEG